MIRTAGKHVILSRAMRSRRIRVFHDKTAPGFRSGSVFHGDASRLQAAANALKVLQETMVQREAMACTLRM